MQILSYHELVPYLKDFLAEQDWTNPILRDELTRRMRDERGVAAATPTAFTRAAAANGYGRCVRRINGVPRVHLTTGDVPPSLRSNVVQLAHDKCPYCKRPY